MLFGIDINGDGQISTPSSDANGDGFIDGLGHYRLKGVTDSDSVDFRGRRGKVLSATSSRSWDALMAKAKDDSSGFDVLIQGMRGRNKGKYQVWHTDDTGIVTSKTRWINLDTLIRQGYETTFNKDFNGDDEFGFQVVDQDGDGLVDEVTHYALFKEGVDSTPNSSVDLIDFRGQVLSDASSRRWNVIQAAYDGSEFKILAQGERGRRRSQYQVWTADSTGQLTGTSRWLTGNQLAINGYEFLFSFDINNNGDVGI